MTQTRIIDMPLTRASHRPSFAALEFFGLKMRKIDREL
ncbi:hypothetical protein VCHE16_1077 [Vibrio paracholerae HE-16]|nr:hypothetical protein VCHE16_1077 [Vibrio paracholerae HE-16]